MALLLNGKNPAALKSSKRISFTATNNQTTFTVSDGYSVGDVEVYLNGIRLVEGDDYLATNGVDIILTSGANTGDSVIVTTYNQFLTSNSYTKAEADSRYLQLTGGTMSSYIRTPNYGVSSYSDSSSASLEASAGSGENGVGVKVFGRSVATNGGDVLYTTDNRGAGGRQRFGYWNGTSFTSTMTIDASGRITAPLQPYAIVRFVSSDVGAYNNTVNNTVTKPTSVLYNVGNVYNSSTGNFTAPVTGLYEISFSTNIYNAPATSWVDGRIWKNGSMYSQHYSDRLSTGWQLLSFSDKVYMNASDYLNLVFATASGGTGSDLGSYSLLCFRLLS